MMQHMPSSPLAIGLYGGSFDPVHLGHIATAQELLRRLPLQEIRLLPAARSPLKTGATSAQDRQSMLELAIQGQQGLTIDTRELQRPPPSYTVDTLREVRAEVGPEQPLVFIMGVDSFIELPRWKDWQSLTRYAHLLVVSRPGFAPEFAPELAHWLKKRRITQAKPLESRALPDAQGGVLFIETAPHDVASRDIRAALARPHGTTLSPWPNTSHWLNPAVRDYIERHHLYRGDADPQ